MAELQSILIDDFSGGMRRGEWGKYAANQSVDLQNVWVDTTSLVTAKTLATISAGPLCANEVDASTAIRNHFMYYDIVSGKWCVVAKSGKMVWLGVPDSTTWSTSTVLTWWPLLGSAFQRVVGDASIIWNMLRRDNTDTESFVLGPTYGTDSNYRSLYMFPDNPGTYDKLIRWDGFYYNTGTVKITSADGGTGRLEVVHSNASLDWSTTGVRVGDVLYLRDDSKTTPEWRTRYDVINVPTGGYIVWKVPTGAGEKLLLAAVIGDLWDTTGKGVVVNSAATDYVTFNIVRISHAGILPGTTCTTEATIDDYAWPTGNYTWTYRYQNSWNKCAGNPAQFELEYSIADPTKTMTITGWSQVENYTADTIEILRKLDTGAWQKVHELTRDPDTMLFDTTWVDTGVTPTLTYTDEIFLHDAPQVMTAYSSNLGKKRSLFAWKDRLWTFGVGQFSNQVRFSSQNVLDVNYNTYQGFEYWPLYQYPATIEDLVVTAGGFFLLTDPNAIIITMVGSNGSFAENGLTGDSAFVLASDCIYRLSGNDLSSFTVHTYAKTPGPLHAKGVAVGASAIAWVSSDAIYAMDFGGGAIQNISRNLYPQGILGDLSEQTISRIETWRLCWFRDKLFLSATTTYGVDTPDNCFVFDSGTRSWVRHAIVVGDMFEWPVGIIGNGLQAGTAAASVTRTASGVVYSDLYAMLETEGSDMAWISQPLILADSATKLNKTKTMMRVLCCWRPKSVDSTAKLSVYDITSQTAKYSSELVSKNQTITKRASTGYQYAQRSFTEWVLAVDCITPRIKIEWNGGFLEWVRIEYEGHGSDHHQLGA